MNLLFSSALVGEEVLKVLIAVPIVGGGGTAVPVPGGAVPDPGSVVNGAVGK